MGELLDLAPRIGAADDRPRNAPARRAMSSSTRAERLFTLGIFLYVVIRAIPIWRPLQDGSVNPWIFLALDLGTAYPYALAWPRLYRAVRARRTDMITMWATILTGSLVLPYLYVFAAGDDVASWVWIVLGVFLLSAVASAGLRLRKLIGAARA